jgi:hypothetical protein
MGDQELSQEFAKEYAGWMNEPPLNGHNNGPIIVRDLNLANHYEFEISSKLIFIIAEIIAGVIVVLLLTGVFSDNKRFNIILSVGIIIFIMGIGLPLLYLNAAE